MAKKDKKRDQEIQDALLDDLDKFEFFFSNYWKQIIYVCVFIVIIVAVVTVLMKARQSAKFAAEVEIASAKSVDTLQKIINKYADLPAANSARLRMAMMYKEKKEYDKALNILNEIISSKKDDEIRWLAMLDVGYINELKGDKEKAAASFANLGSERSAPEAIRCQANYSAGRLYAEVKKTDKAKSSLEMADIKVNNAAVAFWADQAKKMLNRLKAQTK